MKRIAIIALVAAVGAALGRTAVGQAPVAPAADVVPAPAAPTPPAADAMPPATQAPFDAKALAGTFTGTLPCADCPGINTRIVLADYRDTAGKTHVLGLLAEQASDVRHFSPEDFQPPGVDNPGAPYLGQVAASDGSMCLTAST